MARYYYLAQWDEPPATKEEPAPPDYAPPQGTVGVLDLRPMDGVRYGFFATDRQLTADDWSGISEPEFYEFGDGSDMRELVMPAANKKRWRDLLGISYDQMPDGEVSTLSGCLIWTFERLGDPEQQERFAPPTATHEGMIELHLGGHSMISRRPFVALPQQARENILTRVRKDMGRLYRDCVERGGPGSPTRDDPTPDRDLHRRVATAQMRKYSVEDHRQLYPQEIRGRVEPPLTPHTSDTDDFTDTDSTLLSNHTSDGGNAWSDPYQNSDDAIISGNQLIGPETGGNTRHRLEADFSSDDHYAQAYVDGNESVAEVAARFAAGAHTYYGGYKYHLNAYFTVRLRKIINGSATDLDDVGDSEGQDPNKTIRVSADGSTISVDWDGTETISLTDTSITGNVRTGIGPRYSGDVMDNFEAADLGGGAGLSIPVAMQHYRRMRA